MDHMGLQVLSNDIAKAGQIKDDYSDLEPLAVETSRQKAGDDGKNGHHQKDRELSTRQAFETEGNQKRQRSRRGIFRLGLTSNGDAGRSVQTSRRTHCMAMPLVQKSTPED